MLITVHYAFIGLNSEQLNNNINNIYIDKTSHECFVF